MANSTFESRRFGLRDGRRLLAGSGREEPARRTSVIELEPADLVGTTLDTVPAAEAAAADDLTKARNHGDGVMVTE